MTAEYIKKGPGLSPSQRVGDLARSALYANKPDNWILGESAGDDFGYDFQVTAFDPDGQGAQCAFNIQLKGTTQKDSRLATEKALSYPFDHTTLNLWHRSGFAVVVVIVDLIDTLDPKLATVHYHLANPDLEDILPALPTSQKTVRLHVPTDQAVHKDLDILSVVLPYLDEITEARREVRARRLAGGTTADQRMLIETTRADASASLSQVAIGDEIEALIDASPKRSELQAALAALRSGDYERALHLCANLTERDCRLGPNESAIAAHLKSLAFDAIGDFEGADAQTTLALSLLPDSDTIFGAAAQKQLNAIDLGGEGDQARRDLLGSLESRNGISVNSVKSKILAVNGDFDGARSILKPFPLEKIAVQEIVISIIERDWDRVLKEVAVARDLPTLRARQRLWLEVMESRARFESALRAVPRPLDGDFIIPSNGLPHIDYGELQSAYEASRRAMLAAQRLNWPTDIKYILDVYPVSAMLLGYSSEAMGLLAALGLARAGVTPIREVVAKMAVQFDQPDIALQLSERGGTSPKFEHEASVIAVAALKAGQIDKAMGVVTDDFLADKSTKDVFLTSLLLLGMAANSILRTDLVEKIRARLSTDAEVRHYREILDSAVLVQQSLLRRPDAIRQLYSYWSENGQPAIVGFHILTNTDPRSEVEARLFVEVATNIEKENSLGNEELANYSQALLTIGRVGDAITKLQSAVSRFKDDPKIQSLLGIALEMGGRSPEAFNLFDRLLNEGKASDTAQRYFVEIAARMGFFDRAEQQVRAAFAKATDRKRKLRLLNTLFQLLIAEGTRPEQIEEVAWEYGRQANQSNERDEGIFLQEYLFATLREDLIVKPERAEEFRRRLDAYNEKFPKSKFLWRAELPTEGPPEAMLTALKQAVGLTDNDIEEANTTERKMDRGALAVPFSWRPRRFLRNVTDLFMLWEIRKNAPLERAALHFSSSIAGYDRQVPRDVGACEPVLSLTSLVLLDELGLLALVLQSFHRLVVARATLIALQEARNEFTSGWGRSRATRIVTRLQESFSKIGHPPYELEDLRPSRVPWHNEEKRAMEQPGRVYFSDDIVETYLVCKVDSGSAARPSISTVDFLTWADRSAGLVSPYQVADAIGHMTRLRVLAISVEQRYFIAAIPPALNEATSQSQAEAVLHNAETFRSILDGVWHHFKPFAELKGHFVANVSYLLNEAGANEEVLVSLWLRWLQTVRFQSEPTITPLQKMLLAFLSILDILKSEKNIVGLHWHSFWTAVGRGFGQELKTSEDRVAIEEVARLLGKTRAAKKTETTAMALFEKAKIGLESGTERDAWFNNEYVSAAAKEEKSNQASRD